MCCLWTILIFLGPRAAGIVWWLAQPLRWQVAFNNSWLWPILGLIFVPWLTLMFVLVAPGGIVGFDWVWLGIALVGDIGLYAGGGYGNRDRLGRA